MWTKKKKKQHIQKKERLLGKHKGYRFQTKNLVVWSLVGSFNNKENKDNKVSKRIILNAHKSIRCCIDSSNVYKWCSTWIKWGNKFYNKDERWINKSEKKCWNDGRILKISLADRHNKRLSTREQRDMTAKRYKNWM